ncbi:MAG: sigma-70 family RNA polymerase sigma factor [Acidimicrobiaceae bacterium]|nr:sigma-70 family RNA polymerase sigma factor [Acidimicrobiaceae bacterium]
MSETDELMPKTGNSEDWLAAAYEAHRLALFRLARLLTGSDPFAEDVVQEAFARLQATGQVPDDTLAYLRTVVANLCRNRTRRLVLERHHPQSAPLPVENPELDETWAAVQKLPFRQRAVVVLRFYDDLSEAEIAGLLGCPTGTVKSALHRALARLRRSLPHD